MHIYFSGIGGTAIGPLALIAKQAGYTVSGSDKQDSQYIHYLREHGIENIHTGQSREQIAAAHKVTPIDWYVYSSAVAIENPDAPELTFCREQHIKTSKRDELLNKVLSDKQLKLVAVAGTHGKTTTTAMLVWLLKELGLPVSYSIGAKIPFGEMGQYQEGSEYFIYEADEFDRNFLAFQPFVSIITGVAWDHHEIFPTLEDYQQAFRDFIGKSKWTEVWQQDQERLSLPLSDHVAVMDASGPAIEKLELAGRYNRLDAWLAVAAARQLTQRPLEEIITIINRFPGLQRRMEEIVPGLYSDYAHTPDKIRGAMSVAAEMAGRNGGQKVIVIYEPLTNRRMHYTAKDHHSVFDGATALYWVPSYLAREDPKQKILSPEELIKNLSLGLQKVARAVEPGVELHDIIQTHLNDGHMVVAMSGGGGGSLDEWLRKEFRA